MRKSSIPHRSFFSSWCHDGSTFGEESRHLRSAVTPPDDPRTARQLDARRISSSLLWSGPVTRFLTRIERALRAVSDAHVTKLDDDDLFARRILRQQVGSVDLRELGGGLSIDGGLSQKGLGFSGV